MIKLCKKLSVMLVVIGIVFFTSMSEVSAMPFVGELKIVAFNFAPVGWLECEGQLLPIAEYETLFNLIGTTYGGDGMETFALPDLRGLEPYPGSRYCISIFGMYPSPT